MAIVRLLRHCRDGGRRAAGSIGASPAPPLANVRQREQVHTREKHQSERGHCQEAHPVGIPALKHGQAIEDDDQRKSNGQPAVQLPNPFVPVQWFLLRLPIRGF